MIPYPTVHNADEHRLKKLLASFGITSFVSTDTNNIVDWMQIREDGCQLAWPLRIRLEITKGSIRIGETDYVGPCSAFIPSVQVFRITSPLDFTGELGALL